MHSTKPSTVAAALLDSPVGLAAWIGEKWMRWSATTVGDIRLSVVNICCQLSPSIG
jgi:hypothetical protein